MSFSVNQPELGIEWAGSSLGTLFAQRRNLLRIRFWRMLQEIVLQLPFAAAAGLVGAPACHFGNLLDEHGYSAAFRQGYLLPMAAAIWSSSPEEILGFPRPPFFVSVSIIDCCRSKAGRSGAASSAGPRVRAQNGRVAGCPAEPSGRSCDKSCRRGRAQQHGRGQQIRCRDSRHTCARVAGYAADADDHERELLGSVRYQPNLAVLHTDRRFLPQRESLWSAWNHVAWKTNGPVCVTYLLNKLQRLPFDTPLMVTLNPQRDMLPQGEIARFGYQHPIFDQPAIDAQSQMHSIQGRNRPGTAVHGAAMDFTRTDSSRHCALSAISAWEAPWPAQL